MGPLTSDHRDRAAPAGRRLNTPHLLPAATAVLLLALAVGAGYRHARRVERRLMHAVTTAPVQDLAQRRCLQREACRRHDLLLLYGSSEVVIEDPCHVSILLRDYPTGFAPVPIGQKAGRCVLHVQHLAALGRALRGKKVVVSLTATNFFEGNSMPADPYAGNFSRVSANELAFSTDLSPDVKETLARRMLGYPKTLEDDPLLTFALRQLADGSVKARALYYAALPLGRLQVGLLRLQDHWGALGCLHDPNLPPDPRAPAPGPRPAMDWPALAARAEREYRRRSDNNPFGFDNDLWRARFPSGPHVNPPGARDANVRRSLERAPEWDDVETLLQVLHELGAEPLLLVTPVKGTFFDRIGISAEARWVCYDRLRAIARAHDVPLVDFDDHDHDRDFLVDNSHLSSKGWVYYTYAMDAFFHGRRGRDLLLTPTPRPEGEYPGGEPLTSR
jgi:D-alanine transfer protein